MDSKRQPYIILIVVCLLLAAPLRAQDDDLLNDPDLEDLLKQAAEMQKNAGEPQKNPTSLDTGKKLAEMEATAKEEVELRSGWRPIGQCHRVSFRCRATSPPSERVLMVAINP
jgi:hypothetical protein